MINKVEIIDGGLKKVLGNEIFNLKKGLNIIHGNNGIGKSLLMQTIRDYCHIDEVGNIKKPLFFGRKRDELSRYGKINLDWSGDDVFYISHDEILDKHTNLGYEMSTGKRIKCLDVEFIKMKLSGLSTGNIALEVILGLFNLDLHKQGVKYEYTDNGRFSKDYEWEKYTKSFNLDGINTLLLDEIDFSLDIELQNKFFTNVIPKLLEKDIQIILISHSVFKYFIKYDYNLIDLSNNFLENKKLIKDSIINL